VFAGRRRLVGVLAEGQHVTAGVEQRFHTPLLDVE
jgi:hypothetical protein